jgi:hypothetical protein
LDFVGLGKREVRKSFARLAKEDTRDGEGLIFEENGKIHWDEKCHGVNRKIDRDSLKKV